ncbi:MAG: pyridoxamine 5'-phosphate oxidase family protein [Bryobacteraceae bacterium]
MADESLPQLARALAGKELIGTLCTLSRRHPGYPFGSVMPYALDARGRPIFLVSTLAMHTKNLLEDPKASLMVAEPAPAEQALVAARVTLVGEVREVDDASVRERYLARHPDAQQWVDFGDFSFFRLDILDIYYVGGFGVMGWVPPPDYSSAGEDS